MAKASTEKRAHKATYARDKKNGGWLVRVIGPQANMFAGRTVPVTTNSGDEHDEELNKLIWSGVDNGFEDNPGTGKPAALYSFKQKPKEEKSIEF